MGTLFQTFNFTENKTNAPGKGGLYFNIPFSFFPAQLNNKMPCVINRLLLTFFIFTESKDTKRGYLDLMERRALSANKDKHQPCISPQHAGKTNTNNIEGGNGQTATFLLYLSLNSDLCGK